MNEPQRHPECSNPDCRPGGGYTAPTGPFGRPRSDSKYSASGSSVLKVSTHS